MKKIFKVLALFAASALLFSCNKESDSVDEINTPEEQATQGVTPTDGSLLTRFGVTFEGQTKVSVNLGTGVTTIEDDDEALVFVDGSNYAIYVYDESESAFVLKSGETAIALTAAAGVYYPANEFEVSGENVLFVMPGGIEATGDLGAIAPMAGVIAESSGDYSVELKNLASILRVQVTADVNINNVVLNFGDSNKYAEGAKFTVDATASTLTFSEASLSSGVIVSVTPATTADVLFLLPTVALPDGLEVTANLASNHNGNAPMFTIKNASTTAPTRNAIKTMSFYAGLFSGGEGTEGDPYKIASARDFRNLITYSTNGYTEGEGVAASAINAAYYQQTADIDFNNVQMAPIGDSDHQFTGTYDGNSKKLENVSINTTSDNTGLFAYLGGATVKDLTVTGSVSSSGKYVGSIAGRSNGASISRCVNEAVITGGQYAGGIVGAMDDGKVYACVNSANVTSQNTEAGGIVARIQGGTIRACYSSDGVLISGYSRIGGIAGYQSNQGAGASLIINCAAKSNIKSTNSGNNGAAGGLVGYMYSAADAGDVVLTNSVALGSGIYNTWKNTAYLGAIVGQVNGAAALCYVRNCYSQHNSTSNTSAAVYYSSNGSSITSTKQTYMGGIYGYLQKGTVQNCYCVGSKTAGISSDAYAGAGTKGTDGAAGNTRMVVNNVKNGTQAVDVSAWTFYPSNIKDSNATSAYLMDIMNLGTWETAINGTKFSYTSSEGTSETVCEWVGLNGTSPSSYDPAYPSELKDLGSQYYPQ